MKLQWQMVILQIGYRDRIAYFDMFFRHVPNDGGFAIMAGVQH